MSSRSPVHRKSSRQADIDYAELTASCSKKSRVLENMAARSVGLTKEEFDEINQLVEGLNVHGLRYNQAAESQLWG